VIEDCETCHAGNYSEYPCAGCHEGQDMVLAHEPYEVAELNNCIACHPTGRGKALTGANPIGENLQQGISNDQISPEKPQETPIPNWNFYESTVPPFEYQYKGTPPNKP
jgi:hypothetical protein